MILIETVSRSGPAIAQRDARRLVTPKTSYWLVPSICLGALIWVAIIVAIV